MPFTQSGRLSVWGSGGLWGMGAYPGSLTIEDGVETAMKEHASPAVHASAESHLRSCHASSDFTSTPRTARSATSRIFLWTSGPGRFALSSWTRATGGEVIGF